MNLQKTSLHESAVLSGGEGFCLFSFHRDLASDALLLVSHGRLYPSIKNTNYDYFPDHYLVRYRSITSMEWSGHTNTYSTTVTLTDLTPGETYRIQVLAVSDDTASTPQEIEDTLREIFCSEPHHNLYKEQLSFQSLGQGAPPRSLFNLFSTGSCDECPGKELKRSARKGPPGALDQAARGLLPPRSSRQDCRHW